MTKTLINIERTSVVFNKGTINEVYALKNFSLKVDYGDIIIIKGSNGSGKSTLLNLIKKKVDFVDGEIHIKDKNIREYTDFNISKFTSTIYQNSTDGLCPNLTVYENLFMSFLKTNKVRLKKVNGKKIRLVIIEQINKLDIPVIIEKLDEKIMNLSGGQQQLVSLVKASFEKPELLLLDEPTSSLDISNAELVEKLIFNLIKQSSITTLWVTHKDISMNINSIKNVNLTI